VRWKKHDKGRGQKKARNQGKMVIFKWDKTGVWRGIEKWVWRPPEHSESGVSNQ